MEPQGDDRTSSSDLPNGERLPVSNITFDQICKLCLILILIEVFGDGFVTSLML